MANQYRVIDDSYKTHGIFSSKTAAAAFIRAQRAAGRRDLGMVNEDSPKKIKGKTKPKMPAKPKTATKPRATAKPKAPAKPKAAPKERIGPARPYYEADGVALFRDGSLRTPIVRSKASAVQIWLPAMSEWDRKMVDDSLGRNRFVPFLMGLDKGSHLAAAAEKATMLCPSAFHDVSKEPDSDFGTLLVARGSYLGGSFSAEWSASTGEIVRVIFMGEDWAETAGAKPKAGPKKPNTPAKPKAAVPRGGTFSGRDFKPLMDAARVLGDEMPLSSGWIVSDDHVMAIRLDYPGGGFLGMGWGDEALDLGTVSGLTAADVYAAEKSGGGLTFRGRSKTVSAKVLPYSSPIRRDPPEAHVGFEMDAKAFVRELRRAGIIVGGGARGWEDVAYLYEDAGDLMMRVGHATAGMEVDVGDARSIGYQDEGSYVLVGTRYLSALAKIMSHADGPCRLYIGKGAPLRTEMSICGVGAAVFIAPRNE